MTALFPSLLLYDDRNAPRGAAWNMAMDEALLLSAPQPVLRVYAWARPALTFGYFQPLREAQTAAGGRELMRRWTGGGMVLHGQDVTWSLICPATGPFFRHRPAASYALLHGVCGEVLRAAGVAAESVPPESAAAPGGHCFERPVPGDLISAGRKILGAGQRRTRHGLLHQASLAGVAVPPHFPSLLAAALAGEVPPWQPDTAIMDLAAIIETRRYGTEEWLARV